MSPSRFTTFRVILFRIILCSLIIGAGAYLMQSLILTRALPDTSGADESLPQVSVLRLQSEQLPQQWVGYGTVLAIDSANIPVRVNAIVESVPERIRNGAKVDVDEVIAVLDAADYVEQLTISSERLSQVEVGETRLKVSERITKDRRDLALRDVQLAEADYERVEKAKKAGAALSREVDLVEQRLLQARQVVIIQDEVLAQIPIRRAELSSLRMAEEAAVRVARLTKISRISPVDDPATRTFAVYVEVNASDVDLAPGLFVRGEAVSSSEEFRTIIPRRAIRNQRVMLVEDGKMRTQSIVTAFNVNRVRPESGILG